jgi:hypothetical protein
MYIRRQDIKLLEIDHLEKQTNKEIETWVINNNLCNHASWLLPQLVNHFGTWRLHRDGKTTVAENCQTPWSRAIYRISRVKRSLLIRTQTKLPQYGQLTPLLLLGFKRYQGFSYEQFRELPGLEWLLEPDLYTQILLDHPVQLTLERLLEIRAQGLATKSGQRIGTVKPAESTWTLTGIKDTELGEYPKLVQTMLAQIWLAHPKHRTSDMILDPNDWDAMPPPLVDTDVGLPVAKAKMQKSLPSEVMPWD